MLQEMHEAAKKWYFPVWTPAQLQACQRHCYSDLPTNMLQERYRICGGAACLVFHKDYSIPVPKEMQSALNDINAVCRVRYVAEITKIFPSSHMLMHIMVGDDLYGNTYEFTNLDVASEYVGEQLWIHYSAQMITNLQEMFGGTPNEISRHLFIPTAEDLLGKYYEPTDNDTFPAMDSLSPQGMFQFTVAAKHPIGGVETLQKLCKLYDKPKLYFVVPPHQFATFKKQSFKAKTGSPDVTETSKLKQYVLELPVIP
jgi:hypothetical protein